jgi:MoxR-like ATPase
MILEKIKDEVRKAIIGLDWVVELMTVTLLANGHVLLEGVPGIAKTTLSKNFATSLNLKFARIQMTPDLLPADILGHSFYDMRSGEFRIRKGPVFANVVLVDEINRASPKTQSALLEAMEERQVSIEGLSLKLPNPFIVLATRNPVELEGVYELPTAQVDRFMMKINLTYLPEEGEKELLKRKRAGLFKSAKPAVKADEILRAQQEIRKVYVSDAIVDYIYAIIKETRIDERVILGASPRAGEHLLYASMALAYLRGRDYVIPDDVKKLAPYVLSHRILIKPEHEVDGVKGFDIVNEVLQNIEVPVG